MAAKQTRERGKWPAHARISLDLRGAEPVPKGSMKAFVPVWKPGQKNRPVASVTDSKSPELKAFAHHVRELALVELNRVQYPCAQEQPFELLLCFYMPRPGSDFSKATGELLGSARCSPWTKPDIDKLTRATLDALTGLVWDDDARVVRTVIEKRYATRTRDVGLWVECRVQPATMRELAVWQQLATNQQGATA